MMMPFWVRSLFTTFSTSGTGTTVSAEPWRNRPEAGQGARKLKSYMLVGGETEMKPSVSGRRISSCMPMKAPKSKPATQVWEAAGWVACSQSSAVAASASSPMPASNSPWLRPTPREL